MDSSKFNMYKSAADISNLVMKKAIELCHQKMKASYICTFCDSLINEKLNLTYKKLNKGIMLPTCLSINSIVSHDSYTENDDYELKDGDIVRIELACHIDNNVASIGETIKISDFDWNNSNQMISALKAMQVGIQIIKPGLEIIQFKKYIEKVVSKFGYYLVQRPNVFHDPDTTIFYDWCFRDNGLFCEPSWVVRKEKELDIYDIDDMSDDEYDKENIFSVGEIYHLSVCISTNPKPAFESNRRAKIYQKTMNTYNLKSKASRELLNYVNKNYNNRCFKINELEMPESRARLSLSECLNHSIIRGFGVVEQSNSEIVLLKCSIAVQSNNIYKLTGDKFNELEVSEKLDNELNNILKYPKQFDKRDDYLDL